MATKIYNHKTLTNPNIPDDTLLQSCVYMPLESYALADKIIKILNSSNRSTAYNNAIEYLQKRFENNVTETKALVYENITDFVPKSKKQNTIVVSKKYWKALFEFQKEFSTIDVGNVSKGMIIDTALTLYYKYLCSDEYIDYLIENRNRLLSQEG